LRGLILRVLGSDWDKRIVAEDRKLESLIVELDQKRQREQRNFGRAASDELLDFTYPMDLFNIIRLRWKEFEPTFGESTAYWRERFHLLAQVRAPLAHNRVVARAARERAEEVCTEILDVTGDRISRPRRAPSC